jgi:hypothetical protein
LLGHRKLIALQSLASWCLESNRRPVSSGHPIAATTTEATMKTYSNRSNALRAAKASGHQPADVAIVPQGDGFVFGPISGGAAVGVDAKPDAGFEGVPGGSTKTRSKAKPQAGAKKGRVRAGRSKAASPRKQPAVREKTAKIKATKTKIKGKAARQGSKGDLMEAMLRRRGGASVPDLMKATGWQVHTLRARISVSARKNRWKLTRDRKDGVTTYRIGA